MAHRRPPADRSVGTDVPALLDTPVPDRMDLPAPGALRVDLEHADYVGSRSFTLSLTSDAIADLRSAVAEGTDPLGDAGILGLFASPDQREVLDDVQALMSLLEGHGHVVMDRIGEREIVDVHRMSNVLKARRKDPKTAAFMKLVGIEMKLKQYDAGAAFINQVEREASWGDLSMAWESPDALPTLAEIEDASLWLDRMAG